MQELLQTLRTPEDLKALPAERLPEVAVALREEILSVVSDVGGHLASNLGAIELTIALLRIFSPPHDKVLFDVSHQAYAYKLLTGRADRFGTLRQFQGLSGFLKRSESLYDVFGAGHAGTALSAALGFAAARDLRQGDEHVVAVIGDAAMTNGTSLEALNNVHGTTRRLIVILNDNEMSISRNVGALSRHLGRLLANPRYNRMKWRVERAGIERLRMAFLRGHYHRVEAAIKSLFVNNAVFEEFGLRYIGPIDGHDLDLLQNALETARDSDRPVLVHVATRKGKGYEPAESQPSAWHGTTPFNRDTGERRPEAPTPSYSQILGEALVRLAASDERIVALTAAMTAGTGLADFAERFPDRFFDVGICESHQAVFAAGLCAAGLRPVVAVYSSFAQRSLDAIIHDIALQKLPVVFCLDRAGVVAADGPTHHGVFDLAMLRAVPNLVLMQPRNEPELYRMLRTALTLDGPAVIRYPRGTGEGLPLPATVETLEVGRAEVLRRRRPRGARATVALWGLGDFVPLADAVGVELAAAGVASILVDARFVRPIDETLLQQQAAGCAAVVTFENASTHGGLGSAVQAVLASASETARVVRVGWPDAFIAHAESIERLLERHELTPPAIAQRVLCALRPPTGPSAAARPRKRVAQKPPR